MQMKLKVVEYYPHCGEACLVDGDGTLTHPRPTYMVQEIADRFNMHEELVSALKELSVATDEFISASFLMCNVEPAETRLEEAMSGANALLARVKGDADGND